MTERTSVVLAAMVANGVIAVLKFLGFLLTGSPAMLSETYHSISDTGNQVFLLIGIRYSQKDRTRQHPFGYGKAQFFYSFLVSILLFGIAGWESLTHGYSALTHHSTQEGMPAELLGVSIPPIYVNYAVLIGAIAFEGYAFSKAYREMKSQIDERGWSGFREAFRKTTDITTLTALTEDTIALAGVGLALFGIYLSEVTGNPIYDATAAILIGLLLMLFAVALAWENKRLLLGESLPVRDERSLRELIASRDSVTDVVDFRTVYFGPEHLVIAADVAFDPDLDTVTIDEQISTIEHALREAHPDVTKVYLEPES